MTRLGFAEGDAVCVSTASDDGVTREIDGRRVHAFDIPRGCVMGFPLSHHAKESLVPASTSIPVRLRKSTGADEQVAA
jgi:hypothetical protein